MARRTTSRDVYANRYRGLLSFGADASTSVHESFNTGISMTGMQPHKWDILWFAVSPNNPSSAPGCAADGAVRFQLAFGTQTSMLAYDDMQTVTECMHESDVLTSGASASVWPIYGNIRAPLVCLASVLTVSMVAVNVANYNSKTFWYEIGYLTRKTTANEAAEFFAQVGAL